MFDVLLLVSVEVALTGCVVLSRRVRKLERTTRQSLVYAQVGALRHELADMRAVHDNEARWQRRRLREVEDTTARAEVELQMLVQHVDQLSHAMLHSMTQLEERFTNAMDSVRRRSGVRNGKPRPQAS